MRTEEMNPKQGSTTAGEAGAKYIGDKIALDGWVADEQLIDTSAFRNPLEEGESRNNNAPNALASGRRTVRLLWIALIVSLIAHLIIPVCIVTAMVRAEKVTLMDGTQSIDSLRK
jgi:hypothetical protein